MKQERQAVRSKEKQLVNIICWVFCLATIGLSLAAIVTQTPIFWWPTIATIIVLSVWNSSFCLWHKEDS